MGFKRARNKQARGPGPRRRLLLAVLVGLSFAVTGTTAAPLFGVNRVGASAEADSALQSQSPSSSAPSHLSFKANLGGKVGVAVEEELESEERELRETRRRGRWTFIDEEDPVVSAIRSFKDLFPNIRILCEPTTTIKLRKRLTPIKTVLTLGADYNTNLGVWQFRSSWEDSIIGGRITVAGRELMLSKSWLIKLMDSEDVGTRLKFRAALNTRDWTAYAKFGFRTEMIAPLNVKDGFTLCKKLPLDGTQGHAKLEVVTRVALPEPEVQFSTDGDTSRGVIAGMGDVHVGIDELNLLLEY